MKIFIGYLIGWVGMALILAAFALNSFAYLSTASIYYQLINLFGATGLIITSYIRRSFSVLVLNLCWLIIALIGIIKILLK